MSGTCYVQTQVRVLAEPSSVASSTINSTVSNTKQLIKRFSFSAISWPFLPQVSPCSSAIPKESTTSVCSGTLLRQRRIVPASVVAAANLAAASTATTLVSQIPSSGTTTLQTKIWTAASIFISSLPTWPVIAVLILNTLRSSVARNLLNIAVCTALVILIAEWLVVLGSLVAASKVPPGLIFMVLVALFLGGIAASAINHDSAHISRRKSCLNLQPR